MIRNQSSITERLAGSRATEASVELYKRASNKFLKRSRKRTIRYLVVSANLVLLALVAGIVLKTSDSSQTVFQSSLADGTGQFAANPLDQLSSADIAVEVARAVRMDQAVSVKNNADSINESLSVATAASSIVAKPQIISTTGLSKSYKDIVTYTVVNGDTFSSLSAKFGVTSDSIRWSNNLTGASLTPGQVLNIPPVDGIVYKVKSGDTADSLALRYNANKDQIIKFNDAEVGGLRVGELIVIPGGNVRPVAAAASRPSFFGFSWGAGGAYNGYDFGWCTWWVAKRRADIGRPVPTNLGNAYSWYSRAAAGGLTVNPSVPIYGAVMWTSGGNHVSFVEKVEADGSIIVSDMNSRSGWQNIDLTGRGPGYGGWNVASYRRISPDLFGTKYKFIY